MAPNFGTKLAITRPP